MLNLPKQYLSYSQFQMWKQNKNRYIKEYFEGGDKLDTKYLRFGKKQAQEKEDGAVHDTPEHLRFHLNEYEFNCEVNGVPIYGKIDACDPDVPTFREDKTGKIPWTRSKVEKHRQLTFYAMALKQVLGKIPEKAYLVWLETEDVYQPSIKDLLLSGISTGESMEPVRRTEKKPVVFIKEFDEREIERLETELLEIATEISETYTLWQKSH